MKNGFLSSILSVLAISSLILAGCGAGALNKGAHDFSKMESSFASTAISLQNHVFWHGENDHVAVAINEKSNKVATYDIMSGKELKVINANGEDKGQINAPTDIAIADNLVFVLEKGNKRVQVFELPELTSLGFFSEDILNDPSSIAIYRIELGAFYVYVSDSDSHKGRETNYIRKINVARAVNTMNSMYQMTFGYSPQSGYLGAIKDISVDQKSKKVIVTAGDSSSKTAFTLEGVSN